MARLPDPIWMLPAVDDVTPFGPVENFEFKNSTHYVILNNVFPIYGYSYKYVSYGTMNNAINFDVVRTEQFTIVFWFYAAHSVMSFVTSKNLFRFIYEDGNLM